MSRLTLHLFGPPRVERDGDPVHIGRRRALALLAYLAVTDTRHSRETLATLLAPEFDPADARAELRRAMYALKGSLNEPSAAQGAPAREWFVTEGETVALNPNAEIWLDVNAFRRHLAMCATHGHGVAEVCADCLPHLAAAVALYQGEFMTGFSLVDSAGFDDWQRLESEALRQELASGLERLVRGLSDQADYEGAIPHARRWVELDRTYEPAQRALMELYARTGQASAALGQYRTCEQVLAEEMGIEPGPETVALYERIRGGQLPVPSAGVPGSASLSRHNLPAQSAPFVGRERQLAQLRELLARPKVRLLTLTGAGGTGKTRLALQVAAELHDDAKTPFPDGVFFVPLATLRDAGLVVAAIARALGISESPDLPLLESLGYALRDRELLLVLDNFEHVAEAASAVGELLAAAQGLKILVTSRAPLYAYAEQQYPVPPMVTPEEKDLPPLERLARVEAVRLFLQRTERVRPGFTLTSDNAAAVAEICRRLDGLPLAIELAAVRVRLLSPAAMLPHLNERLRFLTGGPRDFPDRQRTLWASLEWSYDLLETDEASLFCQLAVFAGSFSLEAVESVCWDAAVRPSSARLLDLLESLVDQNLVQVSQEAGGPRFTMLETVREYAAERLERTGAEDAQATRDRHAAYFAAALDGWARDLKGPRQLDALAEIERDLDNARVAWDWAIEQRGVAWLDLGLEGLCLYLELRNHWEEGAVVCHKVAERLEERPQGRSFVAEERAPDGKRLRLLAYALAWQGWYSFQLGQRDLADRCFERCLALLDGPELSAEDTRRETAAAVWCMAERAMYDDYERADSLAERSLSIYWELGDRRGAENALRSLGWAAANQAAYGQAVPRLEESLALARELGDRKGIAYSLCALARCAATLGQFERADRVVAEALAIARQVGDRWLRNVINGELSIALHNSGRFSEAQTLRQESLVFYRDQGHRPNEMWKMMELVQSNRHLGAYREAEALARQALVLSHETGLLLTTALGWLGLGRVALAEGAYDTAEKWLEKCLAAFEQVRASYFIGETHAALAYEGRELEQPGRARGHIREALHLATETRYLNTALQALPAMALLLVDDGHLERAVELYGPVSRHPYVANSVWFEDVAGKEIAAAAAALPPDVVATAQERGRARDLWQTAEELVEELKQLKWGVPGKEV